MLKNDGVIHIAVGRNRKEKVWVNKEMKWSELVEKLSNTIRTHETTLEYKAMTKQEQDDIKDVGGFVGGSLKDGRRKNIHVINRSLITLDADHVKDDLLFNIDEKLNCAYCLYSTHKHTKENPRLRIVIPLKRAVSPDEYQAVSRKVAEDLGLDNFDSTTFEAARLMYWPSTSKDGEYIFKVYDEKWLDPDDILQRYPNWRDTSFWPRHEKEEKIIKRETEKQGNPLEKSGIIGAFCRTYSIHDAIEKFLSDIYEPYSVNDRYTYINGSTSGGLVVYENGLFSYSHHTTDPAGGRLCNAFDLVRIHKFGHLDEDVKDGTPVNKLPSYLAMVEFAMNDEKVKKLIVNEKLNKAIDEFKDSEKDSWFTQLDISKNGEIKNTLSNLILILRNDENLKGIYYNELRGGIDIDENASIPWKRLKNGWNKTDEASISGYIDNVYGIYAPGKLKEAVLKVAVERSKHPVREYLVNLPPWDGIERVEELLIKYLGAEDNEYVRQATRKTLVAAIARVMTPGIKFDTALILNGPQGVGKSTLFAKLGMKFFSDSLSISDMRDKTAAEKLQGYWIIEIGELAGIKKVDEETLKAFLTRMDDKFRASYGYSVEDHPRQCIIVGSTNQEAGFLRDITGGRRFWPVMTPGGKELKPWDLTQEDIDMIWAEAFYLYNKGETLMLEGKAEEIAKEMQIDALESDEREGMVREYLEKLLPDNWDILDIYERRSFIRGDEFIKPGTIKRDKVCTMEIWCELFGRDPSSMRKADSYEINAILRKIEGWEKCDKMITIPIYGKQRVYVRRNKKDLF